MKKFILGFILGGIILGTTAYAATLYKAEEVSYTSINTDKNNVQEAIEELYATNSSGDALPIKKINYTNYTNTITSFVITFDVSKYNTISVNGTEVDVSELDEYEWNLYTQSGMRGDSDTLNFPIKVIN